MTPLSRGETMEIRSNNGQKILEAFERFLDVCFATSAKETKLEPQTKNIDSGKDAKLSHYSNYSIPLSIKCTKGIMSSMSNQ